MTERITCPNCGYENSSFRTTCKKCRTNIEEARYEAARAIPIGERLSAEERSEILSQEINHYIRQGYRVVSRTETTAQLVKPKEFNLVYAVLWLLVLIVGFIVYLLYYLSKKDETIYIEVLADGQVIKH